MTKRASSAKKPRQKAASARNRRAAPSRGKTKTAPLRSGKDDVKKAVLKADVKHDAVTKAAHPAKRAVKEDSAPRSFNPFAAMIDSQVQLAGAMLRWSPLGLLLRSRDSTPFKSRRQA